MDGDASLGSGSVTASLLETKLIDLTECLRDSPGFRVHLYEQERQISDLEARLDKVVVGCEKMIEASVMHTEAARFFTNGVKELSEHFKDNSIVANTIRQFCDIIPKLHSLYSVLCDQAHLTILKSLKAFLSGNLSKVKETKKTFDKTSDELNTAINRNAHTPRTKPQEAEEASVALANMENQFSHHAIDYGYQVNTIHCEKGCEVVHNLFTYMRAQSNFFTQGYDLLKECDPFMSQLSSCDDTLKKECSAEMDKMSKRHSLVITQHLQDGSPDEPLLPMDNPAAPIETSGYLFKKGSSGFKSWSRRYFVLRDNKLVYHSRSKAENDADFLKTYVTVADDLRICTVKYAEDQERRFCFEVVTPNKSCMLQADSDAQRKKWMAYLEAGVARALRISFSAKGERGGNRASAMYGDRDSPWLRNRADSDGSAALAHDYSLGLSFLEVVGNDKCADCSSPRPNWASINLGIMVCIKCSGIHRSLGVHITKVRSVTLDDWEPEVQKIMCALGNARVNAIYEYSLPDYVKRPTPNSTRAERETFIKAKYVDHAFVHPHPDFTRREVPRPTPRRPGSPRFPSQFTRPVSTTSLEGLDESSKSHGLSETSSLSSVDPTLFMMAQNLGRVQGFGDKPKGRSTSNLLAKFGDKIINKAKGWKASLQERSPVVGRRDGVGGGREEFGRALVEEELGGVSNHLPLKSNFDDVECKDVPAMIVVPVARKVPSPSSAESVPGPPSAEKVPSPNSSPPPPPKPPRTYKVRRSVSGHGRIDFGQSGRHIPKPPPLSAPSEGGPSNVAILEGNTPGRSGSLPEAGTTPTSEQEKTQQFSSTPLKVDHTPTFSEAELPRGLAQMLSSGTLVGGRHSVVSTGVIPEEGFEEAREMKVAFRDPATIKRSASLSDHRFSIMSEEWFSPNESDDHEEEDDDEDLGNCLRLPPGTPLADEDHFSTPPTSPEYSPIKEHDGGDDGGIIMVAPMGLAPGDKVAPQVTVAGVPVPSSDDRVNSEPIPIFLLPKGDSQEVSQPVLLPLSQDGVSSPANEEDTSPVQQPTNVDQPLSDRASDQVAVIPPSPREHTNAQCTPFAQSPKAKRTSIQQLPGAQASPKTKRASFQTPPLVQGSPKEPTELPNGANQKPQSPYVNHFRASPLSVDKSAKRAEDHWGGATKEGGVAQVGGQLCSVPATSATKLSDSEDVFEDKVAFPPSGGNNQSDNLSLISSFSVQDLNDIFKGHIPVPTLRIHSVDDSVLPSGSSLLPIETGKKGSGGNSVHGRLSQSTVDMTSLEGECGEMESSLDRSPSVGTQATDVEVVVIPDSVHPDVFLFDAATNGNLPAALCALAHGANVNYVSLENDCRTALLEAVDAGSITMTEFLYQNGGKLDVCDMSKKRGCLHHAVLKDDASMVVLLLKKGGPVTTTDVDGKDALDLALEKENVNIVMLLKVTKFNSDYQRKNDDPQLEETVAEVYKDIEVSTEPERLKKLNGSGNHSTNSLHQQS